MSAVEFACRLKSLRLHLQDNLDRESNRGVENVDMSTLFDTTVAVTANTSTTM